MKKTIEETSEVSKDKKNILLVDDDKFLADMYAMKFQNAGFTVHASLSVADAIKTLQGGFAADAVVFDLIMPGGDGFSLLEAIRDQKLVPQALKIALTNEMSDDQKKRVSDLGGTKYIIKATMIPSEVVNTVMEEMGSKRRA